MPKAAEQSTVEECNKLLQRNFGDFADRPRYRIVWSDNQYEMRYGTFADFTSEGYFLREVTETRNVPKYSYIKERWVLERLTEVPEIVDGGPVTKLSYEPIYTFETQLGDTLPVRWDVAKIIAETVNRNIEGAGIYTKYKGMTEEQKQAEFQSYHNALWGNETPVGDALHRGIDGKKPSGIVVPGLTKVN